MTIAKLQYAFEFGKNDYSDWCEWDVELSGEEETMYLAQIRCKQNPNNCKELWPVLERIRPEIEASEKEIFIENDMLDEDEEISQRYRLIIEFQYEAPEDDEIEKEIANTALSNTPSEELTTDYCMAAVKKNGDWLCNVPDQLKTKELCDEAFTNSRQSFRYIPAKLITKEMCVIAVKEDGRLIDYVPKELVDKELALLMVEKAPYSILALDSIPTEIIDEDICWAALKRDGEVIKKIPDELKTYEMCQWAVSHGAYLPAIPRRFYTESLCLEAVRQNSFFSFKHIPPELLTEEMCLIAIRQEGRNSSVMERIPKEKITAAICQMAAKTDPNSVRSIPEEYRTEEVLLTAAALSSLVALYIPENLRTPIFIDRLLAVNPDCKYYLK